MHSRPPRWLGPVVVVSMLMAGCGSSGGGATDTTLAATTTTTTTTVAPTTAVPETSTTTLPPTSDTVSVAWDPILSTTKAKAEPPAATCPDGTDPNVPGPIDQVRPGEGPWNNQAAVFDTHQGRIVYLDETGETWTFDVCTNTWQALNPTGAPNGDWRASREFGEIVYDIDSDRTISFGPYFVSVYDANTNTWTQQSETRNSDLAFGMPGLGAVYDQVSGLVLAVTEEGVLTAYDADADAWTPVGSITEPREVTHEGQTQTLWPPFLVGRVEDADRLVFLGFDAAPFQDDGALINPRDGGTTPLKDPEGGVMGGFGSFRYATSGDTAYTYGERGVCRLNPAALTWDCTANGRHAAMPAATVYDPINERIVVINNWCCTWPGSSVSDDVWAIDMDTGERIELLATAHTRTETDGS